MREREKKKSYQTRKIVKLIPHKDRHNLENIFKRTFYLQYVLDPLVVPILPKTLKTPSNSHTLKADCHHSFPKNSSRQSFITPVNTSYGNDVAMTGP